MKKVLSIFLIALLSQQVNAKDEKNKPTKQDVIEMVCDGMSRYAQAVMKNRQIGGLITDSLKKINESSGNRPVKDYMKAIVYDAYAEPVWATQENKDNAITEFGNKTFVQCSQSFSSVLGNVR